VPLTAILNFARQEGEFRMEGRPLAQHFAVRTRIDDFVRRNAGERIGRDVADAVAGGLDRVHFDRGEFGQNVGGVFQLRPVELHVLARREVAVAAVVAATDVGQLAQLRARKHSVGNGDSQHRRMALDVEAVLQAQRPELVVGQFAGQVALQLVAILCNALQHQRVIVSVVAIHR
jgi:hypothetical protein